MNNPRPASAKQRALIAYLGYPSAVNATADEAREFIDMAIASEAYQVLLTRWNTDKIKLHPEIYTQEAAEQKASRFTVIFEYCENERENYQDLDSSYWPLKKLNLKVCKQAVEWLDSGYNGWDAELFDSEQFGGVNEKVIETYFVPAIANVAPDFIRKERSGNPNPTRKQESSRGAKETNKQKKKRGCLWWILMFVFAWVFLKLIALFTS